MSYLFKRQPIPNRDMAREIESMKPGQVISYQMTDEQRERMDKIQPYRSYMGSKVTAAPAPGLGKYRQRKKRIR